MAPHQEYTPTTAEVDDMPTPSAIKPVEPSNVECSKVLEVEKSIVVQVIADGVVYEEDHSSDLALNNSDDEYDSDGEDDFIPIEPIRPVIVKAEVADTKPRDVSWMYEPSDGSNSDADSSEDDSIVWDIPTKKYDEDEYDSDEDMQSGCYQQQIVDEALAKAKTDAQVKAKAKSQAKLQVKPVEYTNEITDEDEIKKIILKKIVDDMMALNEDLIRENNKVDLYDLSSLRNVIVDVSKIALLIRQTLVRTDNNGLPMWYGKNNTKLRFGDEEVDAIEFSPVGKVFQTYKMVISYKYSPKFKPMVAQVTMSVILDAITHLVNHKSADVHPYGPFDAHKNDSRVFNLFSGFPHVYDPDYVINQKRVDVWLNHIRSILSDSNGKVYQFFVKYFAHLIQKPHVKTKMVPLIKDTQGCGKNSSFDIFHRFVIGPQSSLVCPSMERITARFNSIRQSKLSIVLDEAFDSNNRSMNNQMKSYITDDRTQIERKSLETIEVNDYANYIILTNNDFGSIIEANDRRYMCLIASENRVGDEKYFDHYYNTLANLEAGRDIFHYLAHVDLTGFKPQAFPLTEHKKELKTKQTNNVVKWLLNMHETLSDDDNGTETQLGTSECGLLKAEGIDTICENVVDCGKRRVARYRTISRDILSKKLAQYIQ